MTREEAKEILMDYRQYAKGICHGEEDDRVALDMAIEALSCSEKPNNSTAEYSSDVISRQDVIDAVMKTMFWYTIDNRRKYDMTAEAHYTFKRVLESLPSADRHKGECRTCARNADNGGYYEPEHRTKCPIQEHYALLLDGYCHLYEQI